MDDLISRRAMLSRIAKIPMLSSAKDAAIDAVLDAPAVRYTPYTDIAPITDDQPPDGLYRGELDVDSGIVTIKWPLPDLVEVVRCKDCRHGHRGMADCNGNNILCDYCDWEYSDMDYCSRGEREEADV